MNKMLWGDKPHSLSAVFDSVSPLEALKNSRLAIGLIAEKPNLKKTIEIMSWTKRATALLGTINEITHPSFEILKSIAQGRYDNESLFALWAMMDSNLGELNADKAFSDKVGSVSHQAISRWAELELKNV
jgi:hypothetical protein